MKLAYVANIRLPTEKAHGLQILKMCEAFARAGQKVTLVVPKRRNPISDEPFSYYGMKTHFPVEYLSVPDTVGWGRAGFLLQSARFGMAAGRRMRRMKPDLIYGRDEIALYFLYLSGVKRIVWESHTGSWNFFARAVAHHAQKIVVISNGLKNFYTRQGVPSEKIIVAHDGVDLDTFSHPQSKEAARSRLELPQGTSIALYMGRLDGWKGVQTLLEASKIIWPKILVVVIGGEEKQIVALSKKYPDVKFLGYRPYREIADNQAAADVLVLPNTGKDEISARFTSPLKLFTYMASGKPIIASDLPSIREVLDEKSAVLVSPDNPAALAEGIQEALSPENALLGERTYEKVSAYTWQARADRIISNFLS